MNATPGHPPSTASAVLAIAATVLAGVAVAVQSRVNGELGQRLDDGFTAALISFGSGWLILLAILAVSPRGRVGIRTVRARLREGRLVWWMLLGGLGGAFFVLAQGLVASVIGVAVFTVAIVTGQTITGLLVDATGFAGVRRTAIGAPRLVGAAVTLVAVGVAVGPGIGRGELSLAAIVMPLIAGIAIGFQQALNGRVRTESQSALAATTINFTVGTAALFTAAVVHLIVAGWPEPLPTNPVLYIGGAIGTIFIAIQSITVARIGVLLLGLSLVTGQLAAALVFDVVAPLGPTSTGATASAVALAFVGVLVASIPTSWLRRRATRLRA